MFDPISSKETKIYVVRDDCPMNTISKKTHHETRYWIIKYVDRKRERVKFKIRTIHEKSIDNKEEECILGSNRRIFERKKEGKEKRLVTRSIKRKKKMAGKTSINEPTSEISSVQFASNYEGSRVRMEGASLKINWDVAWHASDGLISRGFQPEIRPARATRLRPLSLTNARRDWNQRADIVSPLFQLKNKKKRERK